MIPVGIIRTFFKTRAFEYKSEKRRDLSLLGALVRKLPSSPLRLQAVFVCSPALWL